MSHAPAQHQPSAVKMGIPIPNAWLGGIKNVDLVQEFGVDEGFWKSFSDGIDLIQVEDDQLVIQLKE